MVSLVQKLWHFSIGLDRVKTFMKRNLWLKAIFALSVFFLTACQPDGGDFVPIPIDGTTVESYYDRKNVFQVYNDEQVLLKVRGQWNIEIGGSSFYIELTNKSQKDIIIEPNGEHFNINSDERIVASEISYTVKGNLPEENLGNQKLKEAKLENGMIKIKGGQKVELDTGFYFDIKGYSKPKSYFLGKEVKFDIAIKPKGEEEKIYKFAFKYDYYQ